MTNIVNREDLEQQVIDFLRCQYPTTEDFVQYMAKCFKKHNYNVPNHLSHLSKDMRRLILDHLDFLDCISLALTCHNLLYIIIEDNCYWFNRLKRDFYYRPFIGTAKATVSDARKRKTIPIRFIDVYRYARLNTWPGGRTLKTYLQKCHGYRFVTPPKSIQKSNDYFQVELPVSVWPPCVVEAANLSSDTLYSVSDVGYRLVKRTDTELEQLFQISRVHDKFDIHSILWPLDKLRIAHIWENARWIEASATTKCDEAAATRKVKII